MKGNSKHSAETLLTLGVFSVFAILAVLLTLMGARAYRSIAGRMEENNALRSSLSYVANKVRAGDIAGGVSLEERGGMQVLCLSETSGGTTFETLLFFADGWLREYAAVGGRGDALLPTDGEQVTALADFTMEADGDTLLLTAEAEGGRRMTMRVAVRTEGGLRS